MVRKRIVAREALIFLATAAAVGLAAFALISHTPLERGLAAYTAYSTQFVLGLLGQNASIVFAENPHLIGEGFDAELIQLCWGTIEIALWIGAVAATGNRSLKRRLQGVAAGLLVFLAFNPARIALTLRLFDQDQLFASVVAHDFLFRVSLVVMFVVSYAIWYAWPERTGKQKPKLKTAGPRRKK